MYLDRFTVHPEPKRVYNPLAIMMVFGGENGWPGTAATHLQLMGRLLNYCLLIEPRVFPFFLSPSLLYCAYVPRLVSLSLSFLFSFPILVGWCIGIRGYGVFDCLLISN